MAKARGPAAISVAEPGRDPIPLEKCGALALPEERRAKTPPDKMPFSDGPDQPCLVYQSALIGVK
jgi:hypothetical protein